MTARNRVWVARRNLPAPLVPVYLGVWAAAIAVRTHRPGPVKAWWRGFAQGWRGEPGPRRPIRWATVARMTALGRPPLW